MEYSNLVMSRQDCCSTCHIRTSHPKHPLARMELLLGWNLTVQGVLWNIIVRDSIVMMSNIVPGMSNEYLNLLTRMVSEYFHCMIPMCRSDIISIMRDRNRNGR